MAEEINRLEIKLTKLIEQQEMMKAVNSIYRKKNWTVNERVKQISDLGVSESHARTLIEQDRGAFPSYQLTNNNANIRATKDRLDRLKIAESTETKEYDGIGCRIEENYAENRIRLFFDKVPTKEERLELSSNSFKWAPSKQAWQNYINSNSKRFVADNFAIK